MSDASSEPGGDADLARGAFKRRVRFGTQRLDSSELTNLCLELGLRLDARARSSALDMLDPDQEGSIEEETFVGWWEQHRHLRSAL